MKILKEKSREYKGKSYYKYKINLPEQELNKASLKEGDELYVKSTKKGILVLEKIKENRKNKKQLK